ALSLMPFFYLLNFSKLGIYHLLYSQAALYDYSKTSHCLEEVFLAVTLSFSFAHMTILHFL
ncbi:MAG: hypothetical protein MR536_01120, partial [Prevotella sp.]|nr:hypothetical protein [Prevotella sp.]